MRAIAMWTVLTSAQELRIMTYNIRTASRWARVDGGDQANRRTWSQRLSAVAKSIEIGGAAIVGTQEGLTWQIEELVQRLGPSWAFAGGGRYGDGSDEDETAAVLYDSSKVDYKSHVDFWLSETPDKSSMSWGAALPRVATLVSFRNYDVINVHLDHASVEARTEAARLLLRRLTDRPLFLLGDFNAPKDEDFYTSLTTVLFDAWRLADVVSCGSCPQGSFHNWKGATVPTSQWIEPYDASDIPKSGDRHIDAIFLNRRALEFGTVTRARLITDDKRRKHYGGPFASDHYPVCIHFSLFSSDL